jgi:hypothetical protein
MNRIFQGVRQLHPSTDVGVFFCGPKPLGHTLNLKCNQWSQPGEDGTHFTFGKVVLPWNPGLIDRRIFEVFGYWL